jgi:hypothetical protein
MSVNKYQPHVFILPEDDANRQMANGFILALSTRQIQVLAEAGGWMHVRDSFVSDHIIGMERFPDRFMVLLIDFDEDISRLNIMRSMIPEKLRDRVFVIGVLTEPEALRRIVHVSFETIGKTMAGDCRNGTQEIWAHELLRHNEGELTRLRHAVCDFLFPPQPHAAS